MPDVAPQSHAKRPCEGFEDGLDLMVLVGAVGLDVDVEEGGVGEALEEMEEELGGEVADALAGEVGLPDKGGAPAKVEGDHGAAFVHGEDKAVAFDAALVAECEAKGFAECEGGVFEGVVLIDVEVAVDVDVEVDVAMSCDLFEEMVEHTEAGVDVGETLTVEVEGEADVGLVGVPVYGGLPGASGDICGDAVPVVRDEGYGEVGRQVLGEGLGVEPDGLGAEVGGELDVGEAVSDDEGAGEVIVAGEVLGEHGGAGLASWGAVLGEGRVDEDVVKDNPLAGKGTEDDALAGVEAGLREGGGAEAVLVGDHNELKIGMLAEEEEVADDFGVEDDVGGVIELVGVRDLLDEGAVPVDKKCPLHKK